MSALAGPNDVLVSSTLRDLVIGSGLEFEDRGAHGLKGVPGEWHLFAVASPERWVAAKLISPAVSACALDGTDYAKDISASETEASLAPGFYVATVAIPHGARA